MIITYLLLAYVGYYTAYYLLLIFLRIRSNKKMYLSSLKKKNNHQ